MNTHQPVEPPGLPTHYTIGVGELIGVVWRRKACLVLTLALSFALGGVYFRQATPTYEVTCRLLVQKLESPMSEPQQHRSTRDLEFLATQAEILASPAVVADAVSRCNWPIPPHPEVSPVAMMKSVLTARPVMGTDVLSLSLEATDADAGVRALEALVASYRDYIQRGEKDIHLPVLEMLARSEKEIRDELNRLEDEYQVLHEKSPLVGNGQNGADVQLALVDQLERRLAETRGRRIELESQFRIAMREAPQGTEVARVRERFHVVPASLTLPAARANGVALPGPSDGGARATLSAPPSLVGAGLPGAPDLAAIQNQLVQARLVEKQLTTRYGDKYPEVRSVREQISALLAEERRALQAGEDLLRRELDALASSEQQLSDLCQTEVNKAKLLDTYIHQEQQLTNKIARTQSLHESMLGQLHQWQLTGNLMTEGRSAIHVSVLAPPLKPLEPMWPSLKILLAVCAAVGLVAGVAWIAVLEQRAFRPAGLTPALVQTLPTRSSVSET